MSHSIHISFIVPIYNVQNYLAEAVESILTQSVSKEIILVNDGSTDNSLAIALQYVEQYPFIQVVHSKNKGVSAARNTGLRLAQGEYILFLDSDDYLYENIDFQFIYELAKTHQMPVVKGTYIRREGDQYFLHYPIFKEVNQEMAYASSLVDCFTKALPNNWLIPLTCFMIKRDFLLENKLTFDTRLPFGEDTLFNVDLLSLEGKVMEVGIPFEIYRIRPNSAVTKPITGTRIIAQNQLSKILLNRLERATSPELKSCIRQVISINWRHLAQTIEYYPHLEEYRNLITEEVRTFMQYTTVQFLFPPLSDENDSF